MRVRAPKPGHDGQVERSEKASQRRDISTEPSGLRDELARPELAGMRLQWRVDYKVRRPPVHRRRVASMSGLLVGVTPLRAASNL